MNQRLSTECLDATDALPNQLAWAEQVCEWLRWFAEKRLHPGLMDERRMMSPLPVLEFGNKGLMAMEVDPAYGGLGLPIPIALKVFEQLGAIDLTLATFVVNNNCLGIRPFARSAHSGKKAEILPSLAAGREMISFALSEPAAGSNPMGLETVARRHGDGWLISGRKMWIGNAAWANHLNVFCRIEEEGGLQPDLTAFYLHQETPGVTIGEELLTMGMRAMVQNVIEFDRVFVAQENLLGRPMEGMVIANDAMMHTRLAFGAAFMGAMRRCVQIASSYASRRRIATGLLSQNALTLSRLGECNAKIELIDSLLAFMAQAMDDPHALSDDFYVVCKVASSEFLWEVVDAAVQVCGGRGYLENNVLPRFMRDARVSRIYEGPTETLLHYLGQRVLRGGPVLQHVLAERCASPDLARLLDETAGHLLQHKAGLEQRLPPATVQDWLAFKMGQIAQWIILLAVYRHARPDDPHGVAAWTDAQLNQLLVRTLAEAERSAPIAAEALARLSDLHACRVGSLNENATGEARTVDALMRC